MMKETLFKIQQEFKSNKNLVNDFGKFNYRNLETMLGDLKPILNKYRCIILFNDDIVNIGNFNYIKSTVTLSSIDLNDNISSTAFAREDETRAGMSAGQMTGCGSSYSRKYALCGLLSVNEEKDLDSFDNRPKKQNNNNNTNNNVKQVNQNNYVYDNNNNITNNVNNGFNEDFIDDVIEEMESRGNCYGTIKPKTVNITNEDKLNNWYNNQDKNNVEVNKFYNYYTKTLEKGTWKGNLNPELLYTKWCASAR